MDKYAPDLLDLGLKGMIGKGKRSHTLPPLLLQTPEKGGQGQWQITARITTVSYTHLDVYKRQHIS